MQRMILGVWDILAAFAERVTTWITSASVRAIIADIALFLLVGGLAMLIIVMSLVIMRNLFPDRSTPSSFHTPARASGHQQLRPSPFAVGTSAVASPARIALSQKELQQGRRAGRAVRGKSIDDVLDSVVEAGLAEPRILITRPGFAYLRLYGCRDCPDDPGAAPGKAGCAFNAGLLQAGLGSAIGRGVTVREVACHRTGQAACEYEVWH